MRSTICQGSGRQFVEIRIRSLQVTVTQIPKLCSANIENRVGEMFCAGIWGFRDKSETAETSKIRDIVATQRVGKSSRKYSDGEGTMEGVSRDVW